jgi:hypothetical protein
MAIIVAQADGNWSAGATWTGGIKPGASDTAQTGNYTVTIDENVTCVQLEPTGSGHFEVTAGGITIAANVVMSSSYTGGGLRCTHSSGTVNLTGNVTGGSGANTHAVTNMTAGGILTVNGTATGGSGFNASGIYNYNGTLNLTAAVGGSGDQASGMKLEGTGTSTLGTATGGTGPAAHGATILAAGTLHVTTAIGNGYGVGGSTTNIAHGVYGYNVAGSVTRIKAIQYGPYGASPIGGAALITEDPDNNTATFRKALNGDTLTLIHVLASPIPTAEEIADAVWDEALSGHLTAGSTGKALNDAGAVADPWATELPGEYEAGEAGYILGTNLDQKVSTIAEGEAGSGAIEWEYTLTEQGGGDPIPEADVWVSSDADGTTVIASGRTNASGVVTFYLDSGTVYVWRQKAGWNFTNPDTEIVG